MEATAFLEMETGVEGSKVKHPDPAPRDFYKVKDKWQPGNTLICNGLSAQPIAIGNLNACANACKKCGPICKGFVDDSDNGVCVFKSVNINTECLGANCNKDGYMKCPPGMWSDGLGTNSACHTPAMGFTREVGEGPLPQGGVDLACNNGETTLLVPDYDLSKCANMCRSCTGCKAFVRSAIVDPKTSDVKPGMVCRFKKTFLEGTRFKSSEDAYRMCAPGEWNTGMMGKCGKAPTNFAVQFGAEGGNSIGCNGGAVTMSPGKGNNLDDCGKVCHKCKDGTRTCDGFVVKNGLCHFMTMTGKKAFGGKKNPAAIAYRKCPSHQTSTGSDAVCQFANDFNITVSTGGDADCACKGRDVQDRRFSTAKWKFDIMDAQEVPLFLKGAPMIDSPCTSKTDTNCKSVSAVNQTAMAGTTPKYVKITTDKNDDWCMKKLCIDSKILKKRWTLKENKAQYMNPGVEKDGACAPSTTAFPNNNWGWCRFISGTTAGTTKSNMKNCNTANDYKKAFWQYELEESDGTCENHVYTKQAVPIDAQKEGMKKVVEAVDPARKAAPKEEGFELVDF